MLLATAAAAAAAEAVLGLSGRTVASRCLASWEGIGRAVGQSIDWRLSFTSCTRAFPCLSNGQCTAEPWLVRTANARAHAHV